MDWHRVSRIASLARVLVWLAMIPTAYMFGWLASVTFVALASLYANVASDYASWRSDVNPDADLMQRLEKKLDKLLKEAK